MWLAFHKSWLQLTAVLLIPKGVIGLWRIGEFRPLRDDERRVDLSFLNTIQERTHIFVHMGLAILNVIPLFHGGTEGDRVQQPEIDARV